MKLVAIAAMAENRVIGRDGDLPWRLPDDLRHFMRTTLGRVCIMGRATFESMDGPLPKRTNLVVTRNREWSAEGAEVAHSVEEALERAVAIAGSEAADDLERCPVICGGSHLYESTLNQVGRLILTIVHASPQGDTLFPVVDWPSWKEISSETHAADDRNEHAFTICTYDRIACHAAGDH